MNGSCQNTWCSPKDATLQVHHLLQLSETQLLALIHELYVMDEDHVLVVQQNLAWVGIHREAAANDVFHDFIGEFDVERGEGRDPKVARHFVYHFSMTSDIGRCKDATVEAFPLALALSPLVLAPGLGAGGIQNAPMVFCAIVHNIAIWQDDVERSKFFYT